MPGRSRDVHELRFHIDRNHAQALYHIDDEKRIMDSCRATDSLEVCAIA